jgi:hypothetical protein
MGTIMHDRSSSCQELFPRFPQKNRVRFLRLYRNPLARKETKPVTLAVSMYSEHGVILCAESQITEGQAKYDEMKIGFCYWSEDTAAATVGAGWWDYLKMAYEELRVRILNPKRQTDAFSLITSLVTEIYSNQIAAHPGIGTSEKPSFSLLTAIMERNDPFPYVIKSVDTAVHNASPFDCVGVGQDLARYLGSKLYRRSLSEDQAAVLAAYILEEAKHNVEGCGGLSKIIWIGRLGIKEVSLDKIDQLHAWFANSRATFPDLEKIPKRMCPILENIVSVSRN